MTEEAKTEKPAETPAAQPSYVTKEELETMMSAQQQHFAALLTRAVETLQTPTAKPAPATTPSFYERPEEAAEELFNKKMQPMVETYSKNESARQLQEVATLPHASKYLNEIQQEVAKLPIAVQAAPGVAREAYHLVIGRHLDEIRKAEKAAEAERPEFTETATAGAPAPVKSKTLTEQEKQIAIGMGIEPDEYQKWRDNPAAMAAAAMKRS